MKILVVDDHAYNRDLLSFILEDEGHSIVEAQNGVEACQKYAEDESINLVLMDVNMPEMDGISATRSIKGSAGDRFTPVIFITALDDSEMVARCLEAGGDDFVPKPVNENVLLAKINAHSRSQALYNKLQEANKTLEYHKHIMDREHAMVEQVFANCSYQSETVCENLRHYTSPMSLFNGDLVLSAPSPSGGVYFLVGDFTGHGLSAAVGSLPVTEIFSNNVQRNASISQIATQINSRLHDLLPSNMFFCAVIGFLDNAGTTLTIWSGGMNDILCVKPGAKELLKIEASHMPLGIQSEVEFEDKCQVFQVSAGERFVVYTDGVNEATNPNGEEFGLNRLEQIVLNCAGNSVEAVTKAVKEFCGGSEQTDDVSIVELTTGPLVHRSTASGDRVEVGANYYSADSFPWCFSMRLDEKDLRNTNVVTMVLDFLGSIKGIEIHLDKIFTIVSELFSNALEHGVLKLDSSLKKKVDGFELYYKQREERLKSLTDAYIHLDLSYERGNPNTIEIVVKDSGEGFDVGKDKTVIEANDENCGRGMHLLRSLCSDIEYSENGTRVTAVYLISNE